MIASLVMPCAALLLASLAPGGLRASTFTTIVALAIGAVFVVVSTWKHAQPVESLRQELYRVDHPVARAAGTSWDRWDADGDRADARGRVLAGFWLSAAVTGLIAYARFA